MFFIKNLIAFKFVSKAFFLNFSHKGAPTRAASGMI